MVLVVGIWYYVGSYRVMFIRVMGFVFLVFVWFRFRVIFKCRKLKCYNGGSGGMFSIVYGLYLNIRVESVDGLDLFFAMF